MTTSLSSSRWYAALRPNIVPRIRSAAATSVVVRSILLALLAVGVTAGGVAAGALIVAPVVASTTGSIADAATSPAKPPTIEGISVKMTASAFRQRLSTGVDRVLAQMPEPVARYALPTVAILSITGALLALFLPSRESRATVRSMGLARATPARGLSALTPKSSGWVSGKKQSPSAVEAMAASGATALDIAWRTGLPLDAVQLLLSLSAGHRQLHPPTA